MPDFNNSVIFQLYMKTDGSLGIKNILILLLCSIKLHTPIEHPIKS